MPHHVLLLLLVSFLLLCLLLRWVQLLSKVDNSIYSDLRLTGAQVSL